MKLKHIAEIFIVVFVVMKITEMIALSWWWLMPMFVIPPAVAGIKEYRRWTKEDFQ